MNNHTIAKDYIARFLPANPIIIEAGAHIGRDTIKMARQWPEAIIHAFEPVPELNDNLIKNTADYPSIHTYPLALSDSIGERTFFKSSGRSTATSSLLEPHEYKQEYPETLFDTINISTITLDEWAKQYNVDHVDFLWFDMQGGELNAFRGATSLLPQIKAIYTEVALSERYKNNPLYHEIKDYLKSFGFHVQKEALGKKTWGNVLFIKDPRP